MNGTAGAEHLPPGGSFRDDDGSAHEGYIEAIVAEGITAGCNASASMFCPKEAVTRGQMAAFLVRALELPPSEQDRFLDDDENLFEDDIDAIAAAGITQGCDPPANVRFCPDGPVTRGQMAAFLVRALELPPSDQDRFADDDGGVLEAEINALADAGITLGCNPPTNDRFCASRVVTREQMATFLGRALGLESHPPPLADARVVRDFDVVPSDPRRGGGPETTVAAGPDRLLVIAGQELALTDKHGKVIDRTTSVDFFEPTDVPDSILKATFDPHAVFDPTSGRFFFVMGGGRVIGPGSNSGSGCSPTPCQSYQLLAVSKRSSPASLSTGDWWLYALDRRLDVTSEGVTDTNVTGDRDQIAVDETSVLITSQEYHVEDGVLQGAGIRILEKGPLVNGQSPSTWRDISGVQHPKGNHENILFPVAARDGSGRFFLVSDTFDCLRVVVWVVENPLTSPTLTSQEVEGGQPNPACKWTAGFDEPWATQPGSVPPILPWPVTSGVFSGGSLWAAASRTVDLGSGQLTGAELLEIDVSAWPQRPPTVVHSTLLSEPGAYQFSPTVIGDTTGNVAIVYGQTSPDEFASLYFAHRRAGDSPGTLRDPVLLKAGTAGTTSDRWTARGDEVIFFAEYPGAALDPADGSFWMIGQYAHDRDSIGRGVWTANIRFP